MIGWCLICKLSNFSNSGNWWGMSMLFLKFYNFSKAIVRPAYFLIDLDFWSILIFDIVTKKGGWYDYFNPVTFICAFPMQRAFVKVLIFHYGRGLLLRISRSVVKLLYLALSSLWPYRLVVWAYVRCCRLPGVPYLRFFI